MLSSWQIQSLIFNHKSYISRWTDLSCFLWSFFKYVILFLRQVWTTFIIRNHPAMLKLLKTTCIHYLAFLFPLNRVSFIYTIIFVYTDCFPSVTYCHISDLLWYIDFSLEWVQVLVFTFDLDVKACVVTVSWIY